MAATILSIALLTSLLGRDIGLSLLCCGYTVAVSCTFLADCRSRHSHACLAQLRNTGPSAGVNNTACGCSDKVERLSTWSSPGSSRQLAIYLRGRSQRSLRVSAAKHISTFLSKVTVLVHSFVCTGTTVFVPFRGIDCVLTAFGTFLQNPGALHLHVDAKNWIAPESEPEPFIDDDFCNDWAVVVQDGIVRCPPISGFTAMISMALGGFTLDPYDRDKVDHVTTCLQLAVVMG